MTDAPSGRPFSLWELLLIPAGLWLIAVNAGDIVAGFSSGAIDFPRGQNPALQASEPFRFAFIVATRVMFIVLGLGMAAFAVLRALARVE